MSARRAALLAASLAAWGCGGDATAPTTAPLCHLRQVSAGTWGTAGLGVDGRLWLWHDRGVETPNDWKSLGAVARIDFGNDYLCGVTGDGDGFCQGGHGLRREAGVSAAVTGRALTTARGEYREPVSCFVRHSGSVACSMLFPPFDAALGDDVTALSFAEADGCAQKRDGTLACWGNAVPTGTAPAMPPPSDPPVRAITPLPQLGQDIVQFEVGRGSWLTCAVTSAAEVLCWWPSFAPGVPGEVMVSRLGVTRVLALGADNVKVGVGGNWFAALKRDGSIWTLGEARIENLSNREAPRPIEGLPGRAVDLTAGEEYFCALLEDQTVWCRGRDLGQRSDGPATFGAAPLRGCTP